MGKSTKQPERDWRTLWSVDLEAATVTHEAGWVFKFEPVAGEPGVFDGRLIRQPEPLNAEHAAQASRIAREAGDAYIEARNARH